MEKKLAALTVYGARGMTEAQIKSLTIFLRDMIEEINNEKERKNFASNYVHNLYYSED